MGALHDGHLSLVAQAKAQCDVVIVSVFVNPTQFNNATDFELYPQTLAADAALLTNAGCDALYAPSIREIYPSSYVAPELDLGILDEVLEGKFRPNHFKGVVQVVYRLFDLVKPDFAFFGLKDYQQLAVIQKMTEHFKLPIEIVPCPTIREADGLAMSSRNMRLSPQERQEALFINASLRNAKDLSAHMSPAQLKSKIEADFQTSPLSLEYIEIIHPSTFESLSNKWVPGAIACVVAYSGDVRLIDNMVLVEI